MAGPDRTPISDLGSALAAIAATPGRFGLFAALRLIEARAGRATPLGATRGRSVDEPVRLSQEPAQIMPPNQIHGLEQGGGGPPCLRIYGPGLLGPNGPLPGHVTDEVLARRRRHDRRLLSFMDLFHHRLLALFYRAWADAEPVVSEDRPDHGRFAARIGALIGLGLPGMTGRDAVPDAVKLHHVGFLVAGRRHPDGLETMAGTLTGLPARLVEFVSGWLDVPDGLRWSLGSRAGGRLGRETLLGCRVYDVQHQVELRLGPMDLATYVEFFPQGLARPALMALARLYLSDETRMRVRPLLAAAAVPAPLLSAKGRRLGLDFWIGARPITAGPAGDLYFNTDATSAPEAPP